MARADDGVAAFEPLLHAAERDIRHGDRATGIRTARQAYGLAATPVERVRAARLIASGYFAAGQFGRAERWLRRAHAAAPDAAIHAALEAEIRQVQRQNPLKLRLKFSIGPSDNVNNGSHRSSVLLWNRPFILSQTARALPGVAVFGGVNLNYRLARSKRSETTIGLMGFGRTHQLSQTARQTARGISGTDFSFAQAAISIGHKRRFSTLPGAAAVHVTYAKSWYSNEPLDHSLSLIADHVFRDRNRTRWRSFIGMTRRVALRDQRPVTRILTTGVEIEHVLGNRDLLTLSVLAQTARATEPKLNYSQTRLGLRYGFARAMAGACISLSLAVNRVSFPYSPYAATGRHDTTVTGSATAVFRDAELYGFLPIMGLEVRRTLSNVDIFDRRSIGLRLGVRSEF